MTPEIEEIRRLLQQERKDPNGVSEAVITALKAFAAAEKPKPAPQPPNNRAEQARINGAKSKGPATADGKARSSRNALKHGFAATQNVVLRNEDQTAFAAHLAGYRDSYRPTNYIENEYVEKLASISWRQSRLAALETSMIDFQISMQFDKVEEYFPPERDNQVFHLCLAWQGLARKAYPRPMPLDPNEPPDPTIPPDGLDVDGIELLRRYQLALDRQFRTTLANFRQYRKDFKPETLAQPNEPNAPSLPATAVIEDPPTGPTPTTPNGPAFVFPTINRPTSNVDCQGRHTLSEGNPASRHYSPLMETASNTLPGFPPQEP